MVNNGVFYIQTNPHHLCLAQLKYFSQITFNQQLCFESLDLVAVSQLPSKLLINNFYVDKVIVNIIKNQYYVTKNKDNESYQYKSKINNNKRNCFNDPA